MLEKPKILVIDDEEDILRELKEILNKKGYLAFVALDSDKGLEIFDKERPQICILDIHMPKSRLDGLGILEEIRKRDKTCACIMLSRITDKEKAQEAKKLGADRYVLKPIDYSGLLELIEETIRR